MSEQRTPSAALRSLVGAARGLPCAWSSVRVLYYHGHVNSLGRGNYHGHDRTPGSWKTTNSPASPTLSNGGGLPNPSWPQCSRRPAGGYGAVPAATLAATWGSGGKGSRTPSGS